MITLEELNQMDKTTFIWKIGVVFENTPWIAAEAWHYRPFSTVEWLHTIMYERVSSASNQQKIDLIRAHPDLGSRLKMNPLSKLEQKHAGLDQLTPSEYEDFQELNHRYQKKFGFPFIVAVREHDKDSIYAAMKNRINHSFEIEFEHALSEIAKIAYFRLKDLVDEEGRG